MWVWPGVGHGVSGDFISYYLTRGWGRCKTKSPFDTSSSEHTRERMVTLGGNHICFRKSLSQTFNLIRLDFSSMSPRFPFFCCFVATKPSIRNAHKWFEGKVGSTRLEDTPAMDLQLKGIAIKRLRTRSAAVRPWRDFGLKRLRTRSCHEWESLVSKFRS